MDAIFAFHFSRVINHIVLLITNKFFEVFQCFSHIIVIPSIVNKFFSAEDLKGRLFVQCHVVALCTSHEEIEVIVLNIFGEVEELAGHVAAVRFETQLGRDGRVVLKGAITQTGGLQAIDKDPDLRLFLFCKQKVVRHRLLEQVIGALLKLIE